MLAKVGGFVLMGTNGNTNNSFLDIAQIVSLYIGFLNLYENREQSAHNDVSAANDRQATYLLEELGRRFDEQNQVLKEILEAVKK